MTYTLPIQYKTAFDDFWYTQMQEEQLDQSSDVTIRVHSKRIMDMLDRVASSNTDTIELTRDQVYVAREELSYAVNNIAELKNREILCELLDDMVSFLNKR